MITADQLRKLLPRHRDVASWVEPLNRAMAAFRIDTPYREAAFVAEILHESSGLTRSRENLNYSTAARICKVWPKRFPTLAAAAPYVRQPEKLANRVYSNRMGNGPPESGDGWRFRGGGPLGLTGRSNYKAAGIGLGVPLEQFPERIDDPFIGAGAAAWYWATRGLNELADSRPGEDDTEDFDRISVLINGGTIGLVERREEWRRARTVLGVA